MGHLMSGDKSEAQKMMERLCANREWLDEHIDELTDKYDEGDWIAVLGGEVLSKGSTAEEVKAALGGKAAPETIILFVPGKEIPQPI
jgi:hypothetical protein